MSIDDTFSTAAMEAIVRARFARYDMRIIEKETCVVVIDTGSRVHRFPGKTKREALRNAAAFHP